MMDKLKVWGLWLWDWAKRIFGRSKIVFSNVVGALLAGWVELYDPISMFDWDTVTDKHEVAIGITLGISVLNILLRSFFTSNPANFGKVDADLPEIEEMPEIVPDENAEQTSPKAQ